MDVPLNDGDIKIKDVLEVENTLNIETMDEPNMNDFNVEVDETNLEGENVEEQNFCEPTMSDPDNVLITEVQDNKEFEHEKKISNEPETNKQRDINNDSTKIRNLLTNNIDNSQLAIEFAAEGSDLDSASILR